MIFNKIAAFTKKSESLINEIWKAGYDDGYKNGLLDAWNCIKELKMIHGDCMDLAKILKLFDTTNFDEIIENYSPQEVMEKLEEYNKKYKCNINSPDITVGSEVEYQGKYFVVTNLSATTAIMLDEDGNVAIQSRKCLAPTGAYYKIEDILKGLKSERT